MPSKIVNMSTNLVKYSKYVPLFEKFSQGRLLEGKLSQKNNNLRH